MRARAFTRDLVALGAARYADAIALHAYPWGRYGAEAWDSYRRELAFHADAWDLPVWITETGTALTRTALSRSTWARPTGCSSGAGVERIFWFALTDQKDGPFGIAGRPGEGALRAFALDRPD